jgi:hypothetical protein
VEDEDTNGSESVGLDGSASTDPDGTISSYSWSEGGNEIATGRTPTVTLSTGTHTITLTVTDNDGETDTDTVNVTVSANLPPVADAGPDQAATDDNLDDEATVGLDGSGSHDPSPNGSITSYVWTVGSEQVGTNVTPQVTLPVGTHIVLLTVTDDLGATDTDTVFVTINPQDDDSDGMSDAWEIDTFGSMSVAGQGTDYDQDGATDLDEYVAGTDPTDASSVPPTPEGADGVSCSSGGSGPAGVGSFLLAAVLLVLPFGMRSRSCRRRD